MHFRSKIDAKKSTDLKTQMNTEMLNHYQNISGLLTPDQKTWYDQSCTQTTMEDIIPGEDWAEVAVVMVAERVGAAVLIALVVMVLVKELGPDRELDAEQAEVEADMSIDPILKTQKIDCFRTQIQYWSKFCLNY